MNYVQQSAEISEDGKYRYALMRRFSMDGDGTILFIGLNPSTADGSVDDPTIRREVDFAQRWGYQIYLKGNLYAFRSTKPEKLRTVDDPVGPLNLRRLEAMVGEAHIVVACWGQHRLSPQAATIARWVLCLRHTRCLGFTRNGAPAHPLFLPKTTTLIPVE